MRLFTTFIPMLALIVFFVWGWLEGTYQHCWIVFLVAGGLMAFLPSYQRYKDKDKYNQVENDKKDEGDEEK
jgi:hypothetical protein